MGGTLLEAFVVSNSLDSVAEFTIKKSESIANQSVSPLEDDPTGDTSPYFTQIKKGNKAKVRLVKVLLPTGQKRCWQQI